MKGEPLPSDWREGSENIKISKLHSFSFSFKQIPNKLLWHAIVAWILSLAECKSDGTTNEVGGIDDVLSYLSPLVQMGFEVVNRRPRHTFNQQYNRLARDYKTDKYRIDANSSEESDEESNEHYGNDRKNKVKNRANSRNKDKDSKNKKKKCRIEKRLDMKCTICYDPKNDEKSESCALSTDPKNTNFEYSNDEKYSTKNKGRDNNDSDESQSDDNSGNESESNENDQNSNDDEQKDLQHRPVPQPKQPQPTQPPKPKFNNHNQPRFIPFNSRAPQVFPSIFNPSPRYFNAPANAVRYQTINTPFGVQRVRVVTLSNGARILQPIAQTPPQSSSSAGAGAAGSGTVPPNRQRFAPHGFNPFGVQEMRPQRDLNTELRESGVQPNIPWSMATPQFINSINGDWLQCRKIMENQQTCIECLQSDGRKKECIYSNQAKPANSYKSYSSMKSYENDQPYAFEMPKATVARVEQHKTHEAYTMHVNRGNGNSKDTKENSSIADGVDTASRHREKPLTQPINAATDVVYGIQQPEQFALFFQTDQKLRSNSKS